VFHVTLVLLRQYWNRGVPENGGVADEILFGWQYEVLEGNNAFYKIRTHYGYEGWIAAEEYVSMESVGDAGVCYDAQNSGCAMQLLQVCQNIADVLEAERPAAMRVKSRSRAENRRHFIMM